MPLVEGVGDEVTQFFLVLVVLILGLAAWWSTHIAETPLVRTVLILERRTRQRGTRERRRSRLRLALEENTSRVPSHESQEPDSGEVEESAEVAEAGSSDETKSEATSQQTNSQDEVPQQQPDTPSTIPISPNVTVVMQQPSAPHASEEAEDETCQLRRRRLAFLENMANPAPSAPTSEATEREDPIGAGSIRIRLKYLNDEQKMVQGQLQEPLGDFRRRHFQLELSANKLVRLIFNGQVLARDAASLEEHGLFDNCVVHCLVHQPRSSNTETPQSTGSNPQPTIPSEPLEEREWELGTIVFMFLSFMLACAWYGRCMYSQYFTTTASVALVGLTGVFVVSVVGLMIPDQDTIRQ